MSHGKDSQHCNLSPQQYVLSQLTAWITNARRTNVTIIAGGDFNMNPAQPRGTPLHQWAQAAALVHAAPSGRHSSHAT